MNSKSLRKLLSFLWLGCVLFFGQRLSAQEKFVDVRQKMADRLTAVKTSVGESNWLEARGNFDQARKIWESDVKPMIVEGVKADEQFREYLERMAEVDEHLLSLSQSLEKKEAPQIEPEVNAVIWAISHHPRGFDVPQPRYSAWDWVFGLGIGIGFCLVAVVFGLYLRRSYYRRYGRQAGDSGGKG
jgi:hypothetical protein